LSKTSASPIVFCLRGLVGTYNDHLFARFARQPRIGRDEVVGLEARKLDRRQIERARCFAHDRELRLEIFGRIGAVGLVFGIEFVAEAHARGVENDRDAVARMGFDEAGHHVAETHHRTHGRAVAARERRQRVVGAEDEA